jgi:hypothetical protein
VAKPAFVSSAIISGEARVATYGNPNFMLGLAIHRMEMTTSLSDSAMLDPVRWKEQVGEAGLEWELKGGEAHIFIPVRSNPTEARYSGPSRAEPLFFGTL